MGIIGLYKTQGPRATKKSLDAGELVVPSVSSELKEGGQKDGEVLHPHVRQQRATWNDQEEPSTNGSTT